MSSGKVVYGVRFSYSNEAYAAFLYVSGSNNIIQKFEEKEKKLSEISKRTNLINRIIDFIETERRAEVLSFSFSEDFVLYIMAKVS